MSSGTIPIDDNGKAVLALWNDATGQILPVHVGNTVTGADGKTYALLDVNATITPAVNQRVNAHAGDFVDGSIVTLGTEADAAWSLSGNATEIAILKKLALLLQSVAYDNTNEVKTSLYGKNASAGDTPLLLDASGRLYVNVNSLPALAAGTNVIGHVISDSGSVVQANAGTNLNTSLLALEAGGNLSTIATNTTGVATAANQTTGNTSLATIATNTTGAATAANQSTGNSSLSTIATNTTGVATAANQTTGNTSLSSIATNTGNSATVEGATTDAAVTGDNNGSLSAKLRGLTKILADIWDSTNHLFAMNIKQVAGTTTSVNSGSVDAGTQRIVQGTAATGTKSNVGASASSTTILASNTSRKGAVIYNDSTALLYLDLSGGTASSSSYSVQVPAQSFFELPGPTIYNGAITGIWASATGNARVTEFS